MIYSQIPNSYKYEVIAEAIYGREMEHFHYDFDRINFERLLANTPEGEYRNNLQQRLDDTLMQMANVDAIYAALQAQIDDPAEYQLAVERVTIKREEKKNEVCSSAK